MHSIIHRFLTALTQNDSLEVNRVLRSEAYLQIRGRNRMQLYWTRPRVRRALLAEFSRWSTPQLHIVDMTMAGNSVTVAYQIEVSSNGRCQTFDQFALIKLREAQIQSIILYCYDEVANRASKDGAWSLSFPLNDSWAQRPAYAT